MNYIAEINSFYIWLIENPIPANAQALWHRLMAYCNSFCWKSEFTITNARLSEELSISRQELDRMRNALCQKERIVYKKGTGNQCGSYHIIPFVSKIDNDCVTQTDAQVVHKVIHKVDTSCAQTDTQLLPLNKLNKTKLNKKDNGTTAPTFKKPTIDEIKAYCVERKNQIDPENFFDYYESNGWKVNKSNMKDWKATVRRWEKNNFQKSKKDAQPASYDLDELDKYWDTVPTLKKTGEGRV